MNRRNGFHPGSAQGSIACSAARNTWLRRVVRSLGALLSSPLVRNLLLVLAAGVVLAACATTPTGRKQLQLIPDDQMVQLGEQSFNQLKQELPLSDDPEVNRYVQCVATRILEAVPGERVEDWEIEVFDSEQVNAFALPGGKIGVFTGLLQVTENPSQLAAVIGHEIGHVRAQHSEARVSELLLAQAGLSLADALTAGTRANQIAVAALGMGAQYGILMPHSRDQELEADHLGVEYMAKAGFEPEQSIALWRNMAQAGGQQPPEFLSTHPHPDTRIRELAQLMGDARAIEPSLTTPFTCKPPAHVATGAQEPLPRPR